MTSDELLKSLGGGYFIPMAALNEPMNRGIVDLIAAAKRARWTNAVVRKDGVETVHEADWIKHMIAIPAGESR